MCNIKKNKKNKTCLKLRIFSGYFGVKVLEGGGATEVGWID